MDNQRPPFHQENLDLFWRFIAERQEVWYRRSALGLPGPWTDDPILRHERFTNVYRELDPGTAYAIQRILERDASRQDKLFNLMVYRLIGRADTHAVLGFQSLDGFSSPNLAAALRKIRDSGLPPFTAAYMVSAYTSMGTPDKIENVARLFSLLHDRFDSLFRMIEGAERADIVHRLLQTAYGFGNFLAYQVLVDALYPLGSNDGRGLLPFHHDDWASAGPGARRGIQMLLDQVTGDGPAERGTRPRPFSGPERSTAYDLYVMRWLRCHQRLEFERLDIEFRYLSDQEGREVPLTLANVQNCLCEYHKYVKIRDGTGKGRRKFVAC
jgi:hypothetical protein